MLPSPAAFAAAFAAIQALPTADDYRTTVFRVVPLRPYRDPPLPGPFRVLHDSGPVEYAYRFTPHPSLDPPAAFQPNVLRNPPYLPPYRSGYSIRALYATEDPLTAYREFHQQTHLIYLNDPQAARFWLTVTLSAHVTLSANRVLDLTRVSVRRAIGGAASIARLTSDWRLDNAAMQWAPTQLLAFEAYRSNLFDAIRFPSARLAGGVCLLVFTDRTGPVGPWFVRVDDQRSGNIMDTGLIDETILA